MLYAFLINYFSPQFEGSRFYRSTHNLDNFRFYLTSFLFNFFKYDLVRPVCPYNPIWIVNIWLWILTLVMGVWPFFS